MAGGLVRKFFPKKWIRKSTSRQGNYLGGNDYGYLWQKGETYIGNDSLTAFWASGNGGQYIIVLPEMEMVAVFTGGNFNSPLAGQPFRLLTRFILPAFHDGDLVDTIPIAPAILEDLTGTYFLDFAPEATAAIDIANGRLRILTPDNEYVTLTATSPKIFKGDSPLYGPLTVKFVEGAQGKIEKLITYGSFSSFSFLRSE